MLNIAVVYTDKIPGYEEHFISMNRSGITQYGVDSYVFIGEEYNENITDYCNKSCYRHNSINVFPFNQLPCYQQTFNDTDERQYILSNFYKNKAADMLMEKTTPYGIVIYTHTNIIDLPSINWSFIHDEIITRNPLFFSPDRSFICGSAINMIKYLRGNNIADIREEVIDLKYKVKIPEIEKYNTLFGFRGFEETCDSEKYTYRSSLLEKSYLFKDMKDYDTVYFSNLNLHRIHSKLKNTITKPFILVTGEGDSECPNGIFDTDEELKDFLNWELLKHWFCQNCLITHPKITVIPLGLDYHTMMYYSYIRSDRGVKITPIEQEAQLMILRKKMLPFWERIPVCYGNFQFLTTTKYGTVDRNDAIANIPANLIFYDCKHERSQTFMNQSSFAFVVSPFGQDYECIRTWEALCLGCIPIMKKSVIDSLYDGLPVILVDEWKEVTYELLLKKMIEYKEKHLNNEFMYEKLHKHYWVKLLQNKKDELVLQKA
jgi:hypothetical protein